VIKSVFFFKHQCGVLISAFLLEESKFKCSKIMLIVPYPRFRLIFFSQSLVKASVDGFWSFFAGWYSVALILISKGMSMIRFHVQKL
jgi:hypothetical protein